MKRIILCLIVISCTAFASGRFNLIRTLWVDIAYQDGLERHAVILSQKADEIYQRISNEFGFTLNPRPTVYLIDKTDIANGYANPLNNIIVIYPNEIDPYAFIPSYEEWVSFCFTHELIHLFLANSFSPYLSFASVFGHAVPAAIESLFTPLYLHEGLAIYYETLITNSGRGKDNLFKEYIEQAKQSDVGLRYASSLNTRRWLPGGPAYVQGFSLLSYVGAKYSHDRVMELVRKFTQDPLSGFYRAMKNVGLKDDLKEWLNEEKEKQDAGKISEIFLRASKLDINAWRIYYATEKYNGEEAIYYYDTFTQEHVKLVDVDNIVSFSVNRTRMIAIARYIQQSNSTTSRLYLYSGTVKDLGIDKVVDLSWVNDFELAIIRQGDGGERFIDVYDLRERKVRRVFGPDRSIVPLQITASDGKIIFAAKIDGQIDLFLIDQDKSLSRLTDDQYVELSPKLTGNELYFCADYSKRFELYTLDLNAKRISQTNVKGAISGIVFQNTAYVFKVVPGGFSVFRQQVNPELRADLKAYCLGFEPVQIESRRIEESQSYYDSVRLRFVLPFPYLSFGEGKLDYGIGAALGFWDDLMDTYMVFGCAWSWESWLAKFMAVSKSDASLLVEFDQKNDIFSLATQLDIPFRTNKGLLDDRFDVILGMRLDQNLFLDPRVRVTYRLGEIGGKLHQVSMPDLLIWSDLLPDFAIGFSKSFLVKDIIFCLHSQVGNTDFQYGVQTFVPGPLINLGAIDGFWAIDNMNFSPGFSVKISSGQFGYDVWFKTVVNCHAIYQVPVPFSFTIGIRDGQGYLSLSLEDILNLLFR